MSLQAYQQLQTHSHDDPKLLGNQMPQLISAGISIDSKQLSTSLMLAEIKQFSAQQGWIMYRDELLISAEVPTHEDIIEAEWSNGTCTLKIKLIAADLYQVTQMTAQKEGNELFSEQKVMLRNSLKGNYNTALYHCWWKEGTDQHKGRWLPLTQQFIGFCNDKEQR